MERPSGAGLPEGRCPAVSALSPVTDTEGLHPDATTQGVALPAQEGPHLPAAASPAAGGLPLPGGLDPGPVPLGQGPVVGAAPAVAGPGRHAVAAGTGGVGAAVDHDGHITHTYGR